jgi:hypothetical protein
MTRISLLITLVATAALAGCNNSDHTIVAGGEPDDNTSNATANANVQLPPSITASKSYRCADNSLIYVDWLSDGTARVKHKRDEVSTTISPEIKGDPKASSITFKGQSCKA